MAGRRRSDPRRPPWAGAAFALLLHAALAVGLLSRVAEEPPSVELPPMEVALVDAPPPAQSAVRSDAPVRGRRAERPLPADAPRIALPSAEGPSAAADGLAGAVFATPRPGQRIVLGADCLGGDRARMTAAQRARCDRASRPLDGPAPIIASSTAKDKELAAAASRKAAIVLYRDNLWAPYPGLNCVYRGKCGD